MADLDAILPNIDAHRDSFVSLADEIWGMPELCYAETRSAAAHVSALERHGFRITTGVAGIPTALTGEIGADGPVIAFLGE